MMSDSGSGLEASPMQNVTAQYAKIQRQYQQILDRWTPHILQRWLATTGLLALFLLRIVLAQGVSFCPCIFITSISERHSYALFSGTSVSFRIFGC
jgi:hypothetical protein